MRYNFKSSFDRSFKKLSLQKQELVLSAINKLKVFYDDRKLFPGLGLKNLRKHFWEIRITLKDRLLFSLQGDTASFILVGSHDDIRRFFKKN